MESYVGGLDLMETNPEPVGSEITMPDINSWEELNDFIKKSSKKARKTTAKKASATKSKSRQPISKEVRDTASVIRSDVFQASHFYPRLGEATTIALTNAKEERRFRNTNVAIFHHTHVFGEACVDTCRELLKDES